MQSLRFGQRLNPENVIYALNCGSKSEYKSRDGFIYQADKWFHGKTEVATYWNHPKVPSYGFKYTEDHELHRIERWAHGILTYRLPLEEQGQFVLILKFTEVNWMAEGSRVFNIKIGDTYIRKGFDILRGGHTSEVSLYIQFSFEDGVLVWKDQEIKNGLHNNQLILIMEAVTDNPKIDGLILYRGNLKATDYYKQENIHN